MQYLIKKEDTHKCYKVTIYLEKNSELDPITDGKKGQAITHQYSGGILSAR